MLPLLPYDADSATCWMCLLSHVADAAVDFVCILPHAADVTVCLPVPLSIKSAAPTFKVVQLGAASAMRA